MRRSLLTAAVLLCAGTSVFGVPLTLNTSGTYTAGVPATAWTAPSTPWSLTFTVDSNPVVLTSSAGAWTRVTVTGLVYKLNNATVAVAPSDVAFFSTSNGGLLNVGFFGSAAAPASPTNGFVITGLQAYSGTEAAPTILTNSYTPTSTSVLVAGVSFSQSVSPVVIFNPLITTPIPSSLLLMLVGLAMGTAYLTARGFARS